MADYHTVYKDLPGTTTEWEDLQVKYGNFKPREKPEKPERWAPKEDHQKDKNWINTKDENELEELDDDLDDDRFMEEYRRKRLNELKLAAMKPRFGSVELIKSQDFVREVSQAPEDVWVVVHLFKDGIRECGVLAECLDELSGKYPGTKFVKMISTDCIKNYPDKNLPTIIVYNKSKVKASLVGMKNFGGQKCTPEDVAFTLCQVGPVLVSKDGDQKDLTEKVARDYVARLVSQNEEESKEDEDSD